MKGEQKKKALKEISETEKLLAKVDTNKTRWARERRDEMRWEGLNLRLVGQVHVIMRTLNTLK